MVFIDSLFEVRSILLAGQQLVNHIPNCYLLTNKLGLLNSLQGYDRVCMGIRGREPKLRIGDFIPETYRLEDSREREKFFERFKRESRASCKSSQFLAGLPYIRVVLQTINVDLK